MSEDIKANDTKFLHPIIKSVVETKRRLGLPIQLPYLGMKLNEDALTYIHELFDEVIRYQEELGEYTRRELWVFLEAFESDVPTAEIELSKFLHDVMGCHPRVIEFCESYLTQRNKKLPSKPASMQLHIAAA